MPETIDDGGLALPQQGPVHFFDWPKRPRWCLVVTDEFKIAQRERPNAWVRFWCRVLLGWKWEKMNHAG